MLRVKQLVGSRHLAWLLNYMYLLYSRECRKQQLKSEQIKFATPTSELPQISQKIAKVRSKLEFSLFSLSFQGILKGLRTNKAGVKVFEGLRNANQQSLRS